MDNNCSKMVETDAVRRFTLTLLVQEGGGWGGGGQTIKIFMYGIHTDRSLREHDLMARDNLTTVHEMIGMLSSF